jgi:uncharacterized protein (TIGR03435 family)
MRYLLLAALLLAQSTPAFDVTSVKPNAGTQDFVRFDPQPGGRLQITNTSLRMVVSWAYGVQNTQLVGGPDWFNSARFDFLAKAEGNPTTEEMRLMLRTLIVDRFRLTFHNETREIPVYALVRPRPDARLGPQLSSSDSNCGALPDGKPRKCEFDVRFGNVHGHGMPMELLNTSIAGFTGRVVIDRTGVTGPMDFDLTWGTDAAGPSIFTAVEEQLGLKLEPIRAPVEVMVIDRAERPTAD